MNKQKRDSIIEKGFIYFLFTYGSVILLFSFFGGFFAYYAYMYLKVDLNFSDFLFKYLEKSPFTLAVGFFIIVYIWFDIKKSHNIK